MTEFARQLRRCREKAGYASPRAFFRSVAGPSGLKCSYAQYLNIERGRSVPKPKLFHAILVLLHIWQEPELMRRLCRAYLEAQIDHPECLELILRALGPAAKTPGSSNSPLRRAIQANVAARTRPMTRDQTDLIRRSPAHYWAFQALTSDSSSWTSGSLALALGMPTASVGRALRDLVAGGLVQREGDDHRGLYPEAVITHADEVKGDHWLTSDEGRLGRHWDHMAKRHGQALFNKYFLLRASESAVREYYAYLYQTMLGMDAYETFDKGPDTAFLLAQTSVRRLLPF